MKCKLKCRCGGVGMPKRYIFIGITSIIMALVISEVVGTYDQRAGEMMQMDMVFMPTSFVIMVILEGIYQLIYRFYEKYSKVN